MKPLPSRVAERYLRASVPDLDKISGEYLRALQALQMWRHGVRVGAYTATGFEIFDNGGRPFKVQLDADRIVVRAGRHEQYREGQELLNMAVLTTFVPKGEHNSTADHSIVPDPQFEGNSILAHLNTYEEQDETKHTYLWVGWKTLVFTTTEPVLAFRSIVGNSGVPYPYALTASLTYLLLEPAVLQGHYGEDPYTAFYNDRQLGTAMEHTVVLPRGV